MEGRIESLERVFDEVKCAYCYQAVITFGKEPSELHLGMAGVKNIKGE